MNLIRYNPGRWADFPFDRFFEDFFARPRVEARGETQAEETFLPRVDIREEQDSVVLSAELPGVSKDNLNVQLENGILTVTGGKQAERTDEEKGFYRSERIYGNFKRSFKVPDVVDADQIAAEYVDGVLTVTLPKKPEASPRQIAISGDNGAVKEIAGH